MPQIPGMRRATKKAAKGRKASAKKKPKGGRPGAPARSGGSGSPAGAVPDGLRGAGKGSPESALGGLAGGLPAGLRKPGANDDLAAGLEALILLVEEFFPLDGPPMHGLPVGGLAPGLEFLLQARADRTGALGKGRGGADGTGRRRGQRRRGPESVQFRDRDPLGGEAKHGGGAVIHGGRI